MSDAKTWHDRCRQLEKELSLEKDKVDNLEADNAALRFKVQELEDIITRYHPTDEQMYDRLTALEALVKALPKIGGVVFEAVASCRGEGNPESWVRCDDALAALLTHRQGMTTPIDLSSEIKDDGGYGEHF